MKKTLIILPLFLAKNTSLYATEKEPLNLLPLQDSQQGQTGAPAKLHDIYGPIPLENAIPLSLLLGFAAVLITLGLTSFFLFRKNKKKKKDIPCWDLALKQLNGIDSLQKTDALLYMEKTSDILRNYLENRFDLHSTRQTTREFFQEKQLNNTKEMRPFRKDLHWCFELADMAKFARAQPTERELEQIAKTAQNFVQKTVPSPSEG